MHSTSIYCNAQTTGVKVEQRNCKNNVYVYDTEVAEYRYIV